MQQQKGPKKRRESSLEEGKNRIKSSAGSQEDRAGERMERHAREGHSLGEVRRKESFTVN